MTLNRYENAYNKRANVKYEKILNISTGKYKLVAKIYQRGVQDYGHYWMIKYNENKIIYIDGMIIKEINEKDDMENDNNIYMLFYVKI